MQALCGALCYLLASSAPLILSEGVRSFTTLRYGKLTGLWAQEAVDVGSAQWALAKLDRELIEAHTIIAIVQKLSPAQRLLIIDFFRANDIARITIDANGSSYKRIFKRPTD